MNTEKSYDVGYSMANPIIVLEIPHQMPPKAWVVRGGEEEIIMQAHVASDGFGYHILTEIQLIDCYDVDEVPSDALKIARDEGEVYDINGEWFAKADAQSELDWATDVLFHDLSSGHILYNEYDLKFCVEHLTHQGIKALIALDHARDQIGDEWDGLSKEMIFEIISKQADKMEAIDLDQFETRKEARDFVEADFLSENDIDDRNEEFSCVVDRVEIQHERGDKLLEVLETLGIAHHEGDD